MLLCRKQVQRDKKAMSENPLIVKCASCGSNAQYNIKEQSYCCPACGGKTSALDPVNHLNNWRHEHQNKIKEELRGLPHSVAKCPNCSAEFFFKENEFTTTCPYCDTPMVRKEFEDSDSFPELIIPFAITIEEAKQKLLEFLDKPSSSIKEEVEIAKNNINKMQGYYLPYCLIRGPIEYKVKRAYTNREFHCEAFVETNFINASKDLDNEVLDAMEPYDWNRIIPFDFGCIAGQSVKIRDINDNELLNRAVDEVTENEKIEIAKELDSEAIDVTLVNKQLMYSPVLLPVYYYKAGNFTVSVNGQTGRVSMTNNHLTKRIVNYSGWLALPFLLLLYIAYMTYSGLWDESKEPFIVKITIHTLMFLFFSPFGLTFWMLPKKIKTLIEKKPISSKKCLAVRRGDNKLEYQYGEKVLDDAWPKPIFYERDNNTINNIKFDVDKGSTINVMSFIVLFGPSVVAFILMIPLYLILQTTAVFKTFYSDIGIKMFLMWAIFIYGPFHVISALYNRRKFDKNFIKISDGFLLKARFITKLFIAAMVLVLMSGFAQCGILSTEKLELSDEEKEIEEKARAEELTIVRKTVPALKQKGMFIYELPTKKSAKLLFDDKFVSYDFIFYESNKEKSDHIYSMTYNENEKIYYYTKLKVKGRKKIYKVNTYNTSFVISDLKTEDRWNIKYDKDLILIQKGSFMNEKTLYKIKLEEIKKENYLIYDSSEKILGNVMYSPPKEKDKSGSLAVFKGQFGKEKTKLIYLINDSQPRADGNMLLAAPAVLLLDELEPNLRYVMMLELSQLE